ncbi:unnamed protein product (mitochondrion) [Plasmodiophora brassicae]|uniref:STEEP1 domain-containing protein n=1 Tax=Plasmodiophora brassicae TaxID=37360 RepID=A0A0G4IH43_PLABS|nr:hypothetical protein PBRA_000205 [Plasmodiophora brassicae]SPQ96768.1 unnamed protein product [Plasmodiophora brassicae]
MLTSHCCCAHIWALCASVASRMTDVARDAGQSRSATGRGSSQLAVRYCAHCGASSLITDVDLETSPRRKTDGAAIVSEVESVCRPLMDWSDSATIIKRGPNLVEQQIRLLCKRCTLPLAYRSDSAPGLLYVIDGALSDDPKAFMTKFKH